MRAVAATKAAETCAIPPPVQAFCAVRADAPAIIRTTVPRLPRPLPLLAALLTAGACLPAAAQAAELYAAPGGTPGPAACNAAGAPCSLAAALLAARGSAGADVVNLAPGVFGEVIAATGEADTDVTLRGAGIGADDAVGAGRRRADDPARRRRLGDDGDRET